MGKWVRLSVAAALLLVAGCSPEDLVPGWNWTFMNRSSYNVTVTPNGQSSWEGFVIGPGKDREVKVSEDDGTIYYFFSPSNKVTVDHSEWKQSHIIFRNL